MYLSLRFIDEKAYLVSIGKELDEGGKKEGKKDNDFKRLPKRIYGRNNLQTADYTIIGTERLHFNFPKISQKIRKKNL